jgi:hypothetical protein
MPSDNTARTARLTLPTVGLGVIVPIGAAGGSLPWGQRLP